MEQLWPLVTMFLLYLAWTYIATLLRRAPPHDVAEPEHAPAATSAPGHANQAAPVPASENTPSAAASLAQEIHQGRRWDLRRAVVMMAVLGPCRGLDRHVEH